MSKFTQSQQWVSGQFVADFLDDLFGARGWMITPTSPHEERVLCLGDRHYRRDGAHYTVEYKSGLQTARTGNVFLETISVDSVNKPGWVYTCQADYIFYAALLNGMIVVFRPGTLRAKIEELKAQFGVRQTTHRQNVGYNTHGVVVPLHYAVAHLASGIIHV